MPPTAGSSSGETGVSRMSSSTADSLGSSLPLSSETKDTRWRTRVLGMPAFTAYMDMWSPL